MKILVGIMHCIENEFDQCLAAIDQQTYPIHDRFILSNLPNKTAHNRLYSTFMGQADQVDLFVKIDADMVLSRKTFFEELAEWFSREKDVRHLQIELDDWLTDRRIMGLNVYRNDYKWIRNNELYFVDTTTKGIKRTKTVRDRSILAPAAVHCPDPSPFQSFHFGVHKAVKVLQTECPERYLLFSYIHWEHFAHLELHYKRTNDSRLGLAIAGFLHAVQHSYESRHVDFDCTETKTAFSHYQALSQRQLKRELDLLGPYAWSFLSHTFRYELACAHNTSQTKILKLLRLLKRWRSNKYFKERGIS